MHRLSCLNTSIQFVQQSTKAVFVRCASSNIGRQSNIISKLLAGKKKSRNVWHENVPKVTTIASLSSPTSEGKSSSRRVHVLNKLFMQQITDYMATDATFCGYGLEISRVKTTIDFRLVNVYWIARGDGNDEKLAAILSKSAGTLRYHLSQLKLIGEVPTIQFVKDKFYANVNEVDRLLKAADFGDDFVPSSPSQAIRNDLSSNAIQSDNELPAMMHDIFGLNHAKIMERVTQNMSKVKQAWEKYETKLPPSLEEKYASTSAEERKEAIIRLKEEEFQAFLSQRRRSRTFGDKAPRSIREDVDSDGENGDNYFDEEDTFTDDFEPEQNYK